MQPTPVLWRLKAAGLPLLVALIAAARPASAAPPPATQPDLKEAPTTQPVSVDGENFTVTLAAAVAPQGQYAEHLKGAIEYVLVARGGKSYETLFVTDVPADQLREAMTRIGLEPGQPATTDGLPSGPAVNVSVRWQVDGKTTTRSIDELVVHAKTGKPLTACPWTWTGSTTATNPETGKAELAAGITRSLIGLHFSDSSPLLQNPRAEARQENLYKANAAVLPAAGTAVQIIFARVLPPIPEGVGRVHVFVHGRVQGVGYRAFTQRAARQLGLVGWVKNLSDGRVEAVAEGPFQAIDKLLEQMKRGPRAARVEKMQIDKQRPMSDYKSFDVRY